MPFDGTGFPRVLTEIEARDLAVLRRARHRIRYRSMWWRGLSETRAFASLFGLCAQLAVTRSGGITCRRLDPWERLILQLPNRPPFPRSERAYWDSLRCYNDHPMTTHADILGLFDRAIAELEGGE